MILMRMFMVRIQQVELSSEVEKVYFFTFFIRIIFIGTFGRRDAYGIHQ